MLSSAAPLRAQVVYADGVNDATPRVLTAITEFLVATGSATQSGVISDGGNIFGITKTGAGALTLSGVNTYGGDSSITAGLLIASRLSGGNISALGSGTLRLSGGALRTDVTGTYAQDVVFTAGTSSVRRKAATFVTTRALIAGVRGPGPKECAKFEADGYRDRIRRPSS